MNIIGRPIRLFPKDLDFQKILELDKEHFPMPWTSKGWEELNWSHHLLFGWYAENQLVGFALFNLVLNDDTAHLLKICLQPGQRGLGSSQVFWECCCENLRVLKAKTVYLEVESQNLRAIGFYKRLGFESLRSIKGYYSDGTDATTMQITI